MTVALFAVVMALTIASCGPGSDEAEAPGSTQQTEGRAPAPGQNLDPAQTVEAMLEALLDKRLGEYYYLVSSADKEIKSLDSLQAEFSPSKGDIVTDFLFSRMSFKIDSTTVAGDSAIVYVTSLTPPVQFVMHHANIVERDLAADTDMQTKMSVLGERYRLSGMPKEENHSAYRVVRERNGWRVNVGWAEMAAWLDSRIAEREAELLDD